MLKKHQILILILLSVIPLAFNLIRPNLFGTDTYYFYAVACGNAEITSIPILSQIIFSVMPCDFVWFKIVGFLLLASTVLIVAFMGSKLNKEFGWLAGVFLFLNSLTILEFSRLEDDTFAFPILIFAMLLFLLGEMKSKNLYRFIALGLVLFAGLIWKGAFVYLVAFSLSFIPALIVLILVMVFVVKNLIGAITVFYTNFEIAENLPIIGLAYQLFLLIGFLGAKRFFILQLALFGFLAFINAKFAIHLVPLLAIGLTFVVSKFFTLPDLRFNPAKPYVKWLIPVILIYAFVIAITTGFLILNQFPTVHQMEAVEFAVEQSGDTNVSNDWSYGYYILAAGGKTQTFGGGWPIYNYSYINPILITENPIDHPVCKLLKEWENGGFDNARIRVYDCYNIGYCPEIYKEDLFEFKRY